jgi:hypothetical protein
LKTARLLALVLAVAGFAAACGSKSASRVYPTVVFSPLPAIVPTAGPLSFSTATPPWPAPANAAPYIAASGLPALPTELLTFHIHAHLDIFVNGAAVPVAAGIGIDFPRGQISPLHTHDTTGIIHVESAAPVVFTLGQFLTEWGVRHDADCIAAFCSPTVPIHAYVNGAEFSGNRDDVPINAFDEIATVIGSAPATVPDHYDWPPGY